MASPTKVVKNTCQTSGNKVCGNCGKSHQRGKKVLPMEKHAINVTEKIQFVEAKQYTKISPNL